MRSVMILKGIVASGKSSYARDLMRREPNRWVRISKDNIRAMLHNSVYSPDNEELVHKVQTQLILTALRNNKDLIIDNTHLSGSTLNQLHRLLESVGDVKVMEIAFNISIQEAKRRNALREGVERVPDEVIDQMARKAKLDKGRVLKNAEVYYPPRNQQAAKYVGDVELPRAIITDLDDPLAILNGNRSPYIAAECDILDSPNIPVVECVKLFYGAGYKIIFCSGRKEEYRAATIRFIEKHLPGIQYVLFMRKDTDDRKDAIIKGEIFEEHIRPNYNVLMCLDDRNQVVDFYRNSLGLNVWQVAEGNF